MFQNQDVAIFTLHFAVAFFPLDFFHSLKA